MALQGHAIGELGGIADAQVLLQQAASLALEVARTYCGPWCLGRAGAAHAERGARAGAARAGRGAARGGLRQPQPPRVPPPRDGIQPAARRLSRDAPARGGAARLHEGRVARLERPHHRPRGVPRRSRREIPRAPTSARAARRCCATSRPRTSPGCAAASKGVEGDAHLQRGRSPFTAVYISIRDSLSQRPAAYDSHGNVCTCQDMHDALFREFPTT